MEGKRWRKSTYSNGGEANCLELARNGQGLLARDSKAPFAATLSFMDAAATAWLSAVKEGVFDS